MHKLDYHIQKICVYCVFLVTFFSLSSICPVHAVEARFDRYGIHQGLSQRNIYGIRQDAKGFLWMTTENGLVRFDGYTFSVFRHDYRNSNTLSDNDANCILVDQAGILWIGTWGGGLDRLDPRTRKFRHYKVDPADSNSITDHRIQSLFQDNQGIVWIGTYSRGLNRLDPETDTIQRYLNEPGNPNSLSNNRVFAICEVIGNSDHTLWIGTDRGLNRLNTKTGKFTVILHDPSNLRSLSHNRIRVIAKDRKGFLWIGTQGGLNRLSPQTHALERISIRMKDQAEPVINCIHFQGPDTVWIGTRGAGLIKLDARSLTFKRFLSDPQRPDSLHHNDIRSLYMDHSDNLWIGARGGGLSKLDLKPKKFRLFSPEYLETGNIGGRLFKAVLEDEKGHIWIGTDGGGLLRYHQKSGTVTRYRHHPGKASSLAYDRVWSVYEDRSGNLWVGTYGRGLDLLDPATGTFKHHMISDPALDRIAVNRVKTLLETNDGTLWVGTEKGINQVRMEHGSVVDYAHMNSSAMLSNEYVWCLFQDQDQVIWVGTDKGLNQFNTSSRTFTRYTHHPDQSDSLSNSRIFTVFEDQKHRFWVGTACGLNLFDRDSGKTISYKSSPELLLAQVFGILDDKEGNLWISTKNGLFRLNPETGAVLAFTVDDGLLSNEFLQGAFCKCRADQLIFGGARGLTIVPPGPLPVNHYSPPPVLTRLTLDNRPYSQHIDPAYLDSITLSYRNKDFTFEFTSLDYTNPVKNRYAYKLDGYNDDWFYCGTKRWVDYTNLDPGTYTFRVKGSNSDGIWNETGLSIQLNIEPPFWKTTWFQILLIIGIVVVSNALFHLIKKMIIILIDWRKTHYISHYKVLKKIGAGAMGTVYKVVDLKTSDKLALKIVNEESIHKENTRERFLQESLICETIDHPNIVKIFEKGEVNNAMYYTMEYCKGITLREFIESGRIDMNLALLIAKVLFEIVNDLHEQSVVHRDIKPGNIMMVKKIRHDGSSVNENMVRDSIKILDFGLARFADTSTLTQTGMVLGSLRYLAPEFMKGKKIRGFTYDLYAVGVILFEMLTDTAPYKGEEFMDLVYSMANGEIDPPEKINPNIPGPISDLVMDLIHPEESERLTDYAQIKARFDTILDTN